MTKVPHFYAKGINVHGLIKLIWFHKKEFFSETFVNLIFKMVF